MEQNSPQNKYGEYWEKNKNYIIGAIVVILALIYLVSLGGNNTEDGSNEGQTSSQSTNTPPPGPPPANGNGDKMDNGENMEGDSAQGSGNVTLTGTLKASNSASRGNYIVETNQGTIYLKSKHDYSALIGKQVTLSGEGTLQSLTGITVTSGTKTAQEKVTPPPAPAPTESTGDLTFAGTLTKSDNMARGYYVITKGVQKVYLKSARDYSAWEGSSVTLTAQGTIDSFTGAKLSK